MKLVLRCLLFVLLFVAIITIGGGSFGWPELALTLVLCWALVFGVPMLRRRRGSEVAR